jgi:hypothetical protein
MYCGNNANNRKVLRGELVIGDRYSCMRKGVGQGLHMPYDDSYMDDYVPITPGKAYCGNRNNLPAGYDRFGTLHECFVKGVGVGRRQKAVKVNNKINDNSITQEELIQLCQELNIQGYQGLSRNRLLDLFMEYIRDNQ